MKFGEFSVSLVSWSVMETGSIVPAAVLEKDYLIKHVCKAGKTLSFWPVKLRPASFIQTSTVVSKSGILYFIGMPHKP